MTTKVVGGTVLDLAGSPIEGAQVQITLLTKVAFRVGDSASVIPDYTVFTNASGVWTATVECNDTITPAGTLYEVKETYAFGGWKTYLIQVLTTLPGGTNQVLGLIVPQLSPVGVVNTFLTKALADTYYEPLGGGGGGGSSVTEYVEDDVAPANPTGPTVVAIRADALSPQGSDGDWVALRVTSKGELYVKVVDSVTIASGNITVNGSVSIVQMPSAQTLTDNMANQTTTLLGALQMVWDGANWDRQTQPLTDTQLRASAVPVSLASVPSHNVTNAGTFAVQADTELPTAAALADATANPTVPAVGAFNEMYNGTTWDRVRGDTANGIDVDVTRLPALPAGNNNIGDVDIASIAAGNNNIGDVDVASIAAGTNVIGKVAAEQIASAAPSQVAVSTTSAQLLASNASRKGFMIFNDCSTALFVKFGATASSTSLNVKIPAGAVYEHPIPGGWVYTGRIDAILGTGSGNAYVTEV